MMPQMAAVVRSTVVASLFTTVKPSSNSSSVYRDQRSHADLISFGNELPSLFNKDFMGFGFCCRK